jgi:energy-coupling factor transporter ATP-binding protein EcfA2
MERFCRNTLTSNPFATCYFQPGAIEFQFFGQTTIDSLAGRCLEKPGCYLILGPHGSGKSTLLRSLQRSFDATDSRQPSLLVQLLGDGTANRTFRESLPQWESASVILLDGFEQLSWWNRQQVLWRARRLKRPLVTTTHHRVRGFEVLWETSIDQTTERWVIGELLHNQPVEVVQRAMESDEWHASRRTHGQNLRESLFDMYDWWRAQKP